MTNLLRESIKRGFVPTELRGAGTSTLARAAAAAELFNFGYLVDPDNLDIDTGTLREALDSVRRDSGYSTYSRRMLFPDFPKEVATKDEADFIAATLVGYITDGGVRSAGLTDWEREGLDLTEMPVNPITLEVDSAVDRAQNIADAAGMSDSDIAFLRETGLSKIDFAKIRSSENKAILVSVDNSLYEKAIRSANHADDVLRTLVAARMNVTDNERVELIRNPSMIRASEHRYTIDRRDRRLVIEALDRLVNDRSRDMIVARRGQWQNLARIVHPFEKRYRNHASRELFDIANGNVEYMTVAARVDKAYDEKDIDSLLGLLSDGQLVRQARRVANVFGDNDKLVSRLRNVSSPVTTLVSAIQGLRSTVSTIRNATGGVTTVKNGGASDAIVEALTSALRNRVSGADIDKLPEGEDTPVSLADRDLSEGTRAISRFDTLDVDMSKTIRLFVHWIGNDIDLSVSLIDDKFSPIHTVDYTTAGRNGGVTQYGTVFSGDITYAPGPNGAAEYIDIDLKKARSNGVRYAVMGVISFTGHGLSQVDHVAGIMSREHPDSGEPFEPRTLETAATCSAEGRTVMPLYIDLKDEKIVWFDTALEGGGGRSASSMGFADYLRGSLDGAMTQRELFDIVRSATGATTDNSVDTGAAMKQVLSL